MACAIETLVQILDQYSYDSTPLQKKARLLRDVYVENSSLFENGENQDLEIRIRDAAYEAEDMLIEAGHKSGSYFTQVIKKFDSIVQEISMLSNPVNDGTSLATSSPTHDLVPIPEQQDVVVGFQKDINQLMNQLTSYNPELQIIPMVGTGGSGKTTLARRLYGHSRIADHFDDFAWVTIPQPFEFRSALLGIMSSMKMIPCEMDLMSNEKLGTCVHQNLVGGRYLIVLDDVSHYTAWDMLRRFFPDDKKRSRIMLTTRKWSIANYVESSWNPHQMLPIDEDASFELLRHKVLGRDGFLPRELEPIGRKIARNCRGFPLAIVLIANVLSTERTTDFWNRVENHQIYFINREGSCFFTEEQLWKVLAYSPSISTETSSTSTCLGFDRAISQLMHQLTLGASELQIIPIVGMGGSGKTTLARQLYDHSSIADYFKYRAWVTISQAFDLRVALLGLLDCLLIPNKVHPGSSDEELGNNLSEILKHKRYFIVVDDIWNSSAWEELRVFFPDDHNGSRIVLTTREQSLADYAKSSSSPHEMQPLDERESWELIVQKVFGGNDMYCPPELEEIGRKIARNCNGLPLALVAVTGFLSRSNKTIDAWKRVESCGLYSTGEKEIQDDPNLKAMADLFSKGGRQLLDLINGGEQKIEVIPIVGPGGGSGKKTLARLLYDRSLLAKRFDTHAWVTSSQHKELKSLLCNLLGSLRKSNNEKPCVDDDNEVDERVRIHKALHKKRYLVVLDDIKDKNTWDMLRTFFKDYNNGSRIILTAREWPSDDYDKIKPLKLDPYWELLLHSAFEQDRSSPESEETHLKVNELVHTSEKSRINVFWGLVWQDKSKGESESDLQSNLLSVSYNHLPCHLKPCFLYMGAFPEDYEIKASKIINLWIAEGFVKPLRDRNLEDIAETYLMDLIARNLLSVCRSENNGRVVAVKIHDVFWKFCTEKANEENFLWFKDLEGKNITKHENVRRVSVHSLSEYTDLTGLSSARSFLCFGRVSQDTDPMFLELAFLRVLDVLQFEFDDFPEEMLELINLRYLGFTCRADIPPSISTFQSLLFLAIAKASSLPSELWGIENLRHIKCKETRIWHHDDSFDADFPKKNLQILSNVPASLLSENFLGCYPNLTKLGIFFDPEVQTTDIDLACMHKLESLKCSSSDRSLMTSNYVLNLTFPVSLKKLTLRCCKIPFALLSAIGALPELEQLILQSSDFSDQTEPTWALARGEFPRLCFLKMEDLNLVHWEVNYEQFQELRHWVIRRCPSMQEIPWSIGKIETLEVIEMDTSSDKVVKSVLRIKKEIEEMGMDSLQVVVHNTY